MAGNFRYAYLECTIDGHNKFYEMSENAGHKKFTAKYGKIGTAGKSFEYDITEWNDKYNEKLKKGYVDLNKSNPKPPFEPNKVHLNKINQVMTVIAAHVDEITDGQELLRDVGMVRKMLMDPKAKVKVKGELEADDMVFLNDVWKKVKHYAK